MMGKEYILLKIKRGFSRGFKNKPSPARLKHEHAKLAREDDAASLVGRITVHEADHVRAGRDSYRG